MNETTSVPDKLMSSATALQSFLKAHADTEHQIREILDKRLETIDTNTWKSVVTSLDSYWGKECTDILADVVQSIIAESDQENGLQLIGASAPVEVMNFLRKIISLYGLELEAAFLASNQLPNNWKTFYRDVYYDAVNMRSHLRVRFAKYNGEEPFIEGNADSILELTILMIQTIHSLPDPSFLGRAISDRFIEEANKLIKFLQPPSPEASDKEANSQTDVQSTQSKINE